jgi:hypothetical protein
MLQAGMPFWELDKILFGQSQNIPAGGTAAGDQASTLNQLPVITKNNQISPIREPVSIIKTIAVCITGLWGVYAVAKIINNNARLRGSNRRTA